MTSIGRHPNLFIVGAPKSGTTAMAEYLKQHPDVFISQRKELGYFGSDLQYTNLSVRDANDEEYLRHFQDWQEQKWAGEGSVWYLLSTQAATEIKVFSPEARIVIMLRNPVDVMYSLYYQLVFNGNEDIDTFEEALLAEPDRKKCLRVPRTAMMVNSLFYRDSVKYAEQVQRYFDVFGKHNVHVIIYDDFRQDNAGTYASLLGFLEIASEFRPAFDTINSNKQVRSNFIRNAVKNPLFSTLAHRYPHMAHAANSVLRQWNTMYVARPPMPVSLRRELLIEFRFEIDRLSEVLDRDMSHWSDLPQE